MKITITDAAKEQLLSKQSKENKSARVYIKYTR